MNEFFKIYEVKILTFNFVKYMTIEVYSFCLNDYDLFYSKC